nr:AsmA-like C-terminal region-containing protein [Pseudomonadota bacterium]
PASLGGLTVRDISLDARLQDGQLRVEPLAFDLAGGSLRLTLSLDGGAEPVQAAATAEARQLRLNAVLPGPDLSGRIQGVVGGRIDVKATGARLEPLLASLDGRIELIMADGQVDARILEKMGLDLGEMLLTGKTQMVPIRCGIAVLPASDGVLTLKTFVLDTKDTKVTGRGTINLAERRLDLVLKAHAKDPSLPAADAPIHIEGSFRHPSLYPDKSALAAELGAALLPLVEAGDATAGDCRALDP